MNLDKPASRMECFLNNILVLTMLLPCLLAGILHAQSYPITCDVISQNYKGTSIEDIQVQGNLAFLANGAEGASIIDISNPTAPLFLSKIQTQYGCEMVQSYGFYLYLEDESTLRIFNIQTPSAPVQCGAFAAGNTIMDMSIHNQTAFILCRYQDLIIADLSNPSLPQVIYKIPLPLSGSDFARLLTVIEPYAYVLTRNGRLFIFDISDLKKPKAVSITDAGPTQTFYTTGRHAYVFPNHEPAKIFNIENPVLVQLAATFSAPVSDPCDAKNIGDFMILGGEDIAVYDISTPLLPRLAASMIHLDTGLVRKMAIQDNLICIATHLSGLYIIQMAATNPYQVTNTHDSGPGSLRQALANAALNPNPVPIVFSIPKSDPGYRSEDNVWTIKPTTAYRINRRNLTIDGASQARYLGLPNNSPPKIELDGSSAPDGYGIAFNADDCGLNGLIINNFANTGISFSYMDQGYVYNCYIGTDATGSIARGNGTGIHINHASNIVVAPVDSTVRGCIISGNTTGISIHDSSYKAIILRNIIGSDRSITKKIGNSLHGICLQNSCAEVVIAYNVLADNGYGIYDQSGFKNTFSFNYIGTDSLGRTDLGNKNDGIYIGSTMDMCYRNTIAYNHGYGLLLMGDSHTFNTISKNSIYRNHAGGIDIRYGANCELTPPQILSITRNSVSGLTGANQFVEVFADSSGQGRYFLGTTKADQDGKFMLHLDQWPYDLQVTATTRDEFGNTSKFSTPCVISKVANPENQPEKYTVSQAYPNPFNISASLQITLSREQHTTVQIFNYQGQKVRDLLSQRLQQGTHQINWQGTDDAGKTLASGIYYILCKFGTLQEWRTAVLLK